MAGDTCGKCHSETILNIIVGFTISYLVNFLVVPHFAEGIKNYDFLASFAVTVIFTIASYIRGFSIRRLFAKLGNNYTLLSFFRSKL